MSTLNELRLLGIVTDGLRDDPRFSWVYAGPRDLPDGRLAYVCPLILGQARLVVGDANSVHDGY
jgi:hypothetical protein